MRKFFQIVTSSSSLTERPQISYKLREYFEDFVHQKILVRKKIIIGGKWAIQLMFDFIPETKRYTSDYIFMGKGCIVSKEDQVKIFEFLMPIKQIKKTENSYRQTIQMFYNAIGMFFTTHYKKIDTKFIESLEEEIDFEYLFSLPYPAPLNEQQYFDDVILADGSVTSLIVWNNESNHKDKSQC